MPQPVTSVTGFAMTGGVQGVRCAGRCGERIERRRWRMKRDERVAAVKILSVRRKAAPKFWAPQQGHRPLRSYMSCGTAGGQSRPPLHFCCKLQKARLSGGGGPCFSFFIPFIPPRRWPCRLYRSYSSPAWPRSRRERACSAPARRRPGWQCCG